MKIVYQGRMTGKTYQAIYDSSYTNYTIVCFNDDEINYINKSAKKIGLTIPKPIKVSDIFNVDKLKDLNIEGFIFDDAECAFQYLIKNLTGIDTKMIVMNSSKIHLLKDGSEEKW